jgi:hypothetical protein
MSDGPRVSFDGFSATAIMLLFFWFWNQSGWYRIDCALGVQKACGLVASEYDKKATP